MTTARGPRLPYADPDTTRQMSEDASACATHLPQISSIPAPPSIEYDDFPREVAKREITVHEAAVRLANELHLHLD